MIPEDEARFESPSDDRQPSTADRQPPSLDRLCSTSAAARALGVSQNYVRLLIQRGRIEAVRTDLGFLIDRDELARFLSARGAARRRSFGKDQGK